MSSWKWMIRSVPVLFLAAAPVAFAEGPDGKSDQQVAAAPTTDTASPSQGSDAQEEKQIQSLQTDVKELQSDLAAQSSDERQYLDQNDPLRP